MTSLEIGKEISLISSVQQSGTATLAQISLFELIARRDKAAADAAVHQRIIDRETLRLLEQEENKKRWQKKDWTSKYTGLKGRILSAIWHAHKHRLTLEKIELAGWGKRKTIVPKNTFKSALTQIKKALKKDKSPYTLVSISSKTTGKVKGYGLRQGRGEV